MFIDRQEVGKQADFAGLSDDELDAQIEELLSRREAEAGEGAQAIAATPLKKGMQKPH